MQPQEMQFHIHCKAGDVGAYCILPVYPVRCKPIADLFDDSHFVSQNREYTVYTGTLLGEKVQNVLSAGTHGSTFGGNPVCCAGAINVLERLDEAMLQGVQARSAYIRQELAGAKGVIGVSGLGLMLGIQTEKNAADIIAACREKGVLVIKAKDKLRLLPALNIPMGQLAKAVAVIKECCAG